MRIGKITKYVRLDLSITVILLLSHAVSLRIPYNREKLSRATQPTDLPLTPGATAPNNCQRLSSGTDRRRKRSSFASLFTQLGVGIDLAHSLGRSDSHYWNWSRDHKLRVLACAHVCSCVPNTDRCVNRGSQSFYDDNMPGVDNFRRS